MKVCPVCKAEYPDDCKFCENDGSPLEDKDGKKCPHCGAQLKGKGKFCPECGKSTEVVEEKTEENGCKCPNCGFESDEKLKFCPDCGYSFADNENNTNSTESVSSEIECQKESESEAESDYVLIDAGEGNPFYMCKYEVTQDQFYSVMGVNPSYFKGDKRPVETVSWWDALIFCNLLSEQEGRAPCYFVDGNPDCRGWGLQKLPQGGVYSDGKLSVDEFANGYRLPTVEEWLVAAAGGESYIYAGSDDIDEVAWYKGNSGNMTHKVGQKKPNGYGLYDMTGNVNEWCFPTKPRILRRVDFCGGSYFNEPLELYSASGRDLEASTYSSLGFRIVYNA